MNPTLAENCLPFIQLGKQLRQPKVIEQRFAHAIQQQNRQNRWFTSEFCRHAILAIGNMLNEDDLRYFVAHYDHSDNQWNSRSKIAVISAGNIPLAAFHDFFCILVSGNDYIGKLSSQDKLLLPVLAQILVELQPQWADRITFEEKLSSFDAIIATGSNNSSRYFEYYFEKYPHILRKNRNSAAILSDKETPDELMKLSADIYLYFGLGCRSVSKLYVPEEYDFIPLLNILHDTGSSILSNHNQYLNNLEYQKAIRLMNKQPYMDAGISLLVENPAFSSPISVIHYEYYHTIQEVNSLLESEAESIQCIVSQSDAIKNAVPFGQAQSPTLLDYPDGVDVMQFLGHIASRS